MNDPVKLVIVDDHQMLIDGIKSLLYDQDKFQVIAEANSGREALNKLEEVEADMVITDLSMPEMSGIELVKEVKRQYPHIKILVLSMHNNRETVSEVLMSEAEGFILKNTGKQELLTALERIHNNGTYYSHEIASLMLEKVKRDKQRESAMKQLTPRELEILVMITQECSSEEIADRLSISKRTVDTHRAHILEKTHSSTLVGLIKFAFQNGIGDINKSNT